MTTGATLVSRRVLLAGLAAPLAVLGHARRALAAPTVTVTLVRWPYT